MKIKRPLFFLNRRKALTEAREIFAGELKGLSNLLLDMIDEEKRHNRKSEDLFQELFRECESCLYKLKEGLPEYAGVKITPLPLEAEPLTLPSAERNLVDALREPMAKLFSFSEVMRDASGRRDFDASGLGLMMSDLYREFEAVIREYDPGKVSANIINGEEYDE